MLQALLFDLDGTLVNTHRANFEAYKHALEQHGVTLVWQDFKQTIGMQSTHFLPMLAPGLQASQYDSIRQLKAEHYPKVLHTTELNVPLTEFMKSMASTCQIALVTTAQRRSAEAVLEQHGLQDYFKVIVTANEVKEHKPNPEGYVRALKELGVDAADALAFEDSETGRQAAEAAGLQVIMIKSFES